MSVVGRPLVIPNRRLKSINITSLVYSNFTLLRSLSFQSFLSFSHRCLLRHRCFHRSHQFYTFFLLFSHTQMAKTSKTMPQKEKASSSSSRPADYKTPIEPAPHEYVPSPCILKTDFKVDNPSSVPGRCEHVSMYMCSITKGHVDAMKEDYKFGPEVVVRIPTPEESITTYAKGFLSVYLPLHAGSR